VPACTTATIEVSPQLVIAESVPLKLRVLLLCEAPNPLPVTVTDDPTGPTVGNMLVMAGCAPTINDTPLLVTPRAVTVTGPLVALAGTMAVMLVSLQEAIEAVTPLNFT